jgi:hypothetical protein
MIAAASELAAARMFGLTEFVPHVNTFKNKLDIPGYEIRYSFTKTHPDFPKYALRYKEGVDDPEQIYILIVGGPEQKTRRSATDGYVTPPFRAVGWAYGKDCVQEKYKAPYGVGNYMVPIDGLHEMRTLPEVARV